MATPPDVVAGEVIEVEWGNAVRDWAAFGEVDGFTTAGNTNLTSSFATVISLNLSIPTDWLQWKCYVTAEFFSSTGTSPTGFTNQVRFTVDGTTMETYNIPETERASTQTRRTGMTTTGSRTVLLQAREASGTSGTISEVSMYARAVRTS